jgi:hypothetical protein
MVRDQFHTINKNNQGLSAGPYTTSASLLGETLDRVALVVPIPDSNKRSGSRVKDFYDNSHLQVAGAF